MEKRTKIFPEHLQKLVHFNESLAKYTTFKIGGTADMFIQPTNIEQLREIVSILTKNNINVRILGGGSNILIADENVPNAIVSTRSIKGISITQNTVTVSAGENLASVINKTAEIGLSGLEPLAGIPGTVGGALIMNAGGKYGNISDYVTKVAVLDKNNEIINLSKNQIEFSVRTSSLSQYIVLSSEFILNPCKAEEIIARKKAIQKEKIRTQPYNLPSAGCVFKNPKKYSAGALIDKAGLKGFKVGGAIVSNLHANYILNEENAKASEIIQVIRHICQKVQDVHGIELELEIKLWNLSI